MIVSPATWFGLGAALPAVLCEWLYRVLPGPWSSYLYLWVPLGLAISYCISQLVRMPNTSLVDAFIVFAFSTAVMRIVLTTVVLGDTVKAVTWIALGLLILARVVQAYGGR